MAIVSPEVRLHVQHAAHSLYTDKARRRHVPVPSDLTSEVVDAFLHQGLGKRMAISAGPWVLQQGLSFFVPTPLLTIVRKGATGIITLGQTRELHQKKARMREHLNDSAKELPRRADGKFIGAATYLMLLEMRKKERDAENEGRQENQLGRIFQDPFELSTVRFQLDMLQAGIDAHMQKRVKGHKKTRRGYNVETELQQIHGDITAVRSRARDLIEKGKTYHPVDLEGKTKQWESPLFDSYRRVHTVKQLFHEAVASDTSLQHEFTDTAARVAQNYIDRKGDKLSGRIQKIQWIIGGRLAQIVSGTVLAVKGAGLKALILEQVGFPVVAASPLLSVGLGIGLAVAALFVVAGLIEIKDRVRSRNQLSKEDRELVTDMQNLFTKDVLAYIQNSHTGQNMQMS